MSLDEIKEHYAYECFMESWSELLADATFSEVNIHHNEVCKRYATECCKASLEKASKNIEMVSGEFGGHYPDESSITKESNIILL